MSGTQSIQRRLGINLIWNTLHTWGSTVISVASTAVYARLLQTEQWGVYSTFTWLITACALLINLGWNLTINKLVAEAIGAGKPERGARVFQLVLLIELAGLALLSGVVLAFTERIADALARPELAGTMPLILVGASSLAIYTTCTMGLIALQHYKPMSVTTLITSSLALTGGVLWLANDGGPRGLIAITATANLTNAIVSLVLIARILPIFVRPRVERDLFADMGRYSLTSTAILVLMYIVFERTEVFFLSRSWPAEIVGFYSLTVAMTNIAVNSVPNVVIGPLLSMTAELDSRGDRVGLRQLFDSATRLLILIAPPVGLGGALIAFPLIQLLYGTAYEPVAVAAMLMLPPAALMIVAKPASSLIWGLGKQGLMLRALLAGGVLNLAVDAVVIPRYGLYGAVIGSSCSQVITTVLTTAICLRHLGYTFPWSRFLRATLAAALMLPFGWLPTAWLSGPLLLLVQVAIGAIVYVVGLALFRIVRPEDVALLTRVQGRLPRPLQLPFLALLNRLAH